MNKINHKNLVVNISLSLISIFFCALLLIFVIEAKYFIETKKYLSCAWHDPNTKFDPELGWSPIPNRKISVPSWGTISSNSFGFRSAEIDQNKKQIIVLGDSFAWGFGVNDTETFPYFLDKMVSKLGYQVSNLAVSGYDIGQDYLFLKRHINKFNNLKQVILVICTENDLIGTGRNFEHGKRKPLFIVRDNELILTTNIINEHCLKNLFSRSYFFGRGDLIYKEGIIKDIFSRVAGDKYLSARELELVLIALFQKINELVLNHNAELLVVLSPSKGDCIEKSASLDSFEYIFNNVRFKGLSYIDYVEVLKKEDQKELNSFYLADGHYSRKGNMFLAKTVYEQLHKALKDNR